MPNRPALLDRPALRTALLFAGAAGLTALLLHPAVPDVYRSLRSSLPLMPSRDFGYPAHLTAYLLVGSAAALIVRPQTVAGRRLLLAGLFAHGITTECAQLLVGGRTFDVLDMACNLTAAAVGVRLACPAAEAAAA